MGLFDSVGGFLGFDTGPKAPQLGNQALDQLNAENAGATTGYGGAMMKRFANGGVNTSGLMDQLPANAEGMGVLQNLATNPLTGSRFATQEVENNPYLQQGMDAMKGQLGAGQGLQSSQTGILNGLQNQGFELKPEDQTLYGQESGNIARQFGQQGNQAASNLAQRGLSNSGAAGAMFSGLAGNQNEMLSKAQQQIAQQRFQNTMSQIGQTQQFLGQLNSQNNSAAGNIAGQGAKNVQDQYGRQMSGVQNRQQGLGLAAGLNQGAQNQAMQSAQFNASNTPANFMDYATAGIGSSVYDQGASAGHLKKQLPGASSAQSSMGGSSAGSTDLAGSAGGLAFA